MKKLFLILPLFLFSCGNDNTIEISKEEYKKLKGDTATPEQSKEIIWNNINGREQNAYVTKIENHEMMYGLYNGWVEGFYIVHHPDCKTCKKDTIK
jgi:hypothetical protein